MSSGPLCTHPIRALQLDARFKIYQNFYEKLSSSKKKNVYLLELIKIEHFQYKGVIYRQLFQFLN